MLASDDESARREGSTFSVEQAPYYDQHFQVGRDSVEPSAHEMGRNPLHTMLGKASLFLIYRLSARTARQESLPTSDTLLLFSPIHW